MGKRLCPVCHQLRMASDRTPDGLIHRVVGRSNAIWCPYADDPALLTDFDSQKKAHMQANWRRVNDVKRQKKHQNTQ